jgi:hypothetical protein
VRGGISICYGRGIADYSAAAPTVRTGSGRLASGALIQPVGDRTMIVDPIGGHGANNASHHARHIADEIFANITPVDERYGKAADAAPIASTICSVPRERDAGPRRPAAGIGHPRIADAISPAMCWLHAISFLVSRVRMTRRQ